MPDVVPGQFADDRERGHGDVDDATGFGLREPLEQVAGALEARAHENRVELAGGGRAVARVARDDEVTGLAENQRLKLGHVHGHDNCPAPLVAVILHAPHVRSVSITWPARRESNAH